MAAKIRSMKKPQHPSAIRLFEALAALQLLELRPEQEIDDASTTKAAQIFNESPQRIHNLRVRSTGVSKDFALLAQQKLGISAVWILEGEGPQFVSWPFKRVTQERFFALTQESRWVVEGRLLDAVKDEEADSKKRKLGG